MPSGPPLAPSSEEPALEQPTIANAAAQALQRHNRFATDLEFLGMGLTALVGESDSLIGYLSLKKAEDSPSFLPCESTMDSVYVPALAGIGMDVASPAALVIVDPAAN